MTMLIISISHYRSFPLQSFLCFLCWPPSFSRKERLSLSMGPTAQATHRSKVDHALQIEVMWFGGTTMLLARPPLYAVRATASNALTDDCRRHPAIYRSTDNPKGNTRSSTQMKLEKGQKIALATIGVVAVQSAVIWASYTYGSSDGFREGRSGYMKTPTTNGTITVDANKGTAVFTPSPSRPYYDGRGPWNSKNNRLFLEDELKNNMATMEFGQKVSQQVASAKCSPTAVAHRWFCTYRLLADSNNRSGIYEVNPKTGVWRGSR